MLKYIVLRVLDKIFLNAFFYKSLLSSLFFSNSFFSRNRDEQDVYIQKKIEECSRRKNSLPKVSAIYRVKNGEAFIESSICSVVPLVSEIVVVDNGSSDSTIAIIERLSVELKDLVDIKVFHYSKSLAIAGDNYQSELKEGKSSLAEYYNFAFSKGTGSYLIKVDAHYIFSIHKIASIQKLIKKNYDIIYYRGCEIFGRLLSVEPHMFRKDTGYKYIDDSRYEVLRFSKEATLRKCFIVVPVFLHIKRVAYSRFLKTVNKGAVGLYRANR